MSLRNGATLPARILSHLATEPTATPIQLTRALDASYGCVSQALLNLKHKNRIRVVSRGVYALPTPNYKLGTFPIDYDIAVYLAWTPEIPKAIYEIEPALNVLGATLEEIHAALARLVDAGYVVVTDGKYQATAMAVALNDE
jgi:hypothetical protein